MSERCTSSWLVVCAVLAAAIPAGGQAPGEVFRDCEVCSEMVALPEGDVALGRYEVTLEEYRAFAEELTDPRERRCFAHGPGGRESWRSPGYVQTGRHPVACVSWNEAQVYAEWLSLETGHQYRLPTEAEWERGAAGSPRGCYMRFRNGEGGTCAVGAYGPSDAGLFDMVGNLEEWTDSCWDGDCGRKVLRGADWRRAVRFQRADTRGWSGPGRQDYTIGFRVARTLP